MVDARKISRCGEELFHSGPTVPKPVASSSYGIAKLLKLLLSQSVTLQI